MTKRLLIIEDDYDVSEMLLMYFTAHQYEVYHADNGIEGIDLAKKKFPNLILLDVMLPEMNGYEVCVALRKISLTKHIPVIFLTQKDARADIVSGLELGADDYIAKPFDVDELRLRVQRSIERATRESLHETRTGLPTGAMVEDELERVSAMGETYHQFQFVINGYAAFADKYGFMAADQVFAFAAKSVYEAMIEYGTANDFIGVLNDSFVVLTQTDAPEDLVNLIQDSFRQGARAFYTFADVQQGGIVQNEGTVDQHFVPLMELELQTTATGA